MQLIEEFIRYIQFEKRYSVHTQVAYRNDLKQFEDYLSLQYEGNLVAVSDVMIRSWMMHLIELGCSKRSLNRKLSSLRRFYKYCSHNGQIDVDPMQQIASLKVGRKIPSFISKSEMAALLDEIEYPENFEGYRDRAILEMFYNTGIRLSELIGVKLSDIDFNSKSVKVLGKRAKERIVPLVDSHLKNIKHYILYRERLSLGLDYYLFVTKSGEILYPKLVYRIVNSYLSKVTSVKQKSPHMIRHAFATHMLNDGADLNAIKEVLGHASLASTQIYTRSTAERLKEIYKQAHPRGD